MNAKAIVLAAVMGMCVTGASVASAADYKTPQELARRGYDRYERDRYERDYRHDRGGRYERDRHYHERYAVKYHLHGERRLHAKDEGHARWVVDMLRNSGVHAEVRHHCEVVYHMHGEGRRAFRSHEEAHRFERSLCDLGFDVKVIE